MSAIGSLAAGPLLARLGWLADISISGDMVRGLHVGEQWVVGELKGRAGKPWTEYENSILRAMGNGGSRAVIIAKRLGRPTSAVQKRAAELRIALTGDD